ncbi:MAG: DUF4835 family protein [Prevotellaceae bacterium]|jgi:hypothetical protein|nr:DUF4835 family protein [Prevotellaceae bacterium]
MKKFLLPVIGLLIGVSVQAQELKANVTVNSSQIQGTNRQVFDALQLSLNELMNNSRWTTMTFGITERIECTFALIVKSHDASTGAFVCEMQVQARRPVHNTSYLTMLLNFRDKQVNFTYAEFDRLEINTATYDNNLTAIMAYYAYLIIGFDGDSFQRLGGTPSFQMAEQIVNLSQSRSAPDGDGWKAFDNDQNRYALISNMLDERFKRFREFFYEYHRLGLDAMSGNTDNARARIAAGLPVIRDINRQQPGAIAIISFLDAKNDELINIFTKHGTSKEKEDVYNVLADVNPMAISQYEKIKQ